MNPFSSVFLSVRNLIHRTGPLERTVGGVLEPQRLLISLASLKFDSPSLNKKQYCSSLIKGELSNVLEIC